MRPVLDLTRLNKSMQGTSYKYNCLPFGYSLDPRTFSKCVEMALEPLWRQRMRVLFYLDDLLLLAHSPEESGQQKAELVDHLSSLGFAMRQGLISDAPSGDDGSSSSGGATRPITYEAVSALVYLTEARLSTSPSLISPPSVGLDLLYWKNPCALMQGVPLGIPSNHFIAALLLNSVLYSTVIYPKILFDVLSEKQIISHSACLFQWFVTYSLGGSEFLLLAAMSYDRYVSICKPLQYPTIMRKTNICILLVVAWILPAGQAVVTTGTSANMKLCKFNVKGIICNSTVLKLQCETSRELNIFGLVCLVNLLILPVLFILFTYIRIFIITYRSGREVRRKAAQTCLP
ncbi:olfactory receptor 140-like, partial [Mastacembelus armatus]|uniref:olfactory receptor 140-like n=1 Tax=Mastacembelus armatus TaxID=205130 RepID=UPI000E45758B